MVRFFISVLSVCAFSSFAQAEVVEGLKLKAGQSFPAALGGADFFTASTEKGLRPDFKNVLQSKDFKKALPFRDGETNCRDLIKTLVCVVEPSDSLEPKRTCLPESESYAEYFERVYDLFTPFFQKMFCSLDVIYIEKEMSSTAYGGILKDGFVLIGIRKSMLDAGMSFDDVYSWKEQLNFGLDPKAYEQDPALPAFQTNFAVGPMTGFLYKVLTHEFGHIFDFANHLNAYTDGCERGQGVDCKMAPGSWGDLSWATMQTVKPEHDYANRAGLCFYGCEGHFIDRAAINDLYIDMFRSNFITSYASTNPYDDFADSLAFYMVSRRLDASVKFDTRQGVNFDILRKVDTPQFAAKKAFVEEFLARQNVVYP